jgi:uncharacterized protein YjiK
MHKQTSLIHCLVNSLGFRWTWIAVLMLAASCKHDHDFKNPIGYEINEPAKVMLPADLDEISGMVYYPADTSVFAICDDKGSVYKISLTANRQISKWKFGPGEDYEDVVLLDSTFYIMQSNGDMHVVRIRGMDSVLTETFTCTLPGENEFEGLYYEPDSARLVLVCKECEEDDDKDDQLSAYAFNPATGIFEGLFWRMDVRPAFQLSGQERKRFKPAAAAIHTRTGDLYILSSINNLLVSTDRKGQIKAAWKLPPKWYKQPEGLAFTPSGGMLISNESADIGPANILLYAWIPQAKPDTK